MTAARGFRASGVSAGIKRSRKPDLALIVADEPVTAAAVFTANRIQAAPVLISKARLRAGAAQAVLLNSGCANCMTGPQGLQDARRLSGVVAQALGLRDGDVLVASTGLIGRRLPAARMERAVPALVGRLHRAHHRAAAEAILTTDRLPKEAAVETRIGGRLVRVGGMAKGAGMIAPSMATMLCVITTDAAIAPGLLRRLLREATERTFNRISVDGDMSTNDTVFALASGRSGATVQPGPSARAFQAMLRMVEERLAMRLVQDGEGATKLMDVEVIGGRTNREAQACARQVACSPLVKTMLAGGDPNVGRIAAAAGSSGAWFDPDRLEIAINGRRVVSGGTALPLGKGVTRSLLVHPRVSVRLHLHAGTGRGRMLTCDLTEAYVRINARYAT